MYKTKDISIPIPPTPECVLARITLIMRSQFNIMV